MSRANLVLEPQARLFLAVSQQDDARIDLPDQVQEFVPICMGGEIKILHLAFLGQFSSASAENKRLPMLCRLEPSSGGVRIGVAHEKNRLPLVARHPDRQIMGGGVLAHHASRDDEDAAAR